MQTTKNAFVGIDVSKSWIDVSVMLLTNGVKSPMLSQRFDNTKEGLKGFTDWLKKNTVPFDEQTLVVIENTGIYHRLLWEYCTKKGLPLHIGNAAAIKWSLGITRGKDDKTDSQRLCLYCYQHREELQATPVLDPVLLPLKDLMSARTRLLLQINSIKGYLRELKNTNSKEVQRIMEQAHQAALKGLKDSLKKVEVHIKGLVKQNEAIRVNYELLLTVPGIGHITAVYLICSTANFAGQRSGKQLACYAGVAPFQSSSGSSIKGKARVHPMANKTLKKLLHLCALSAVKNHPEFRDYYERKKAEGKHAMTILNAVRNKIVLRAAAVIKKQTNYVDNYQKAA